MSITTNDPLLEEMSPPFQDNFDCYVCHKVFKTKFLLKRHIKIHVENPVNCKICNIKLKHIMSLKRHMHLVHQISDHGGLFLYHIRTRISIIIILLKIQKSILLKKN